MYSFCSNSHRSTPSVTVMPKQDKKHHTNNTPWIVFTANCACTHWICNQHRQKDSKGLTSTRHIISHSFTEGSQLETEISFNPTRTYHSTVLKYGPSQLPLDQAQHKVLSMTKTQYADITTKCTQLLAKPGVTLETLNERCVCKFQPRTTVYSINLNTFQ